MKQMFLANTILARGLIALLMAGMTGSALGGSKPVFSRHVTISNRADGSGSATAYLGGVYNGTGVREEIGCGKLGNDTGHTFFYCFIHDDAGVFKACDGPDSSYLAQSFSAISPDSRVTISWNTKGRCTSIDVVHSSEYEDKEG